MKLKHLLCVLIALFTVFLLACNTPKDTDTDTDNDTQVDTSKDTDTNINTDTNTDIESDTDTDTESSIDTDTNTDTEIDVDSDTDTNSSPQSQPNDSQQPDPEPEPEPEPEPGPEPEPVDVEITLFENGQSEYTIVYPKNNEIIEYNVKELVSRIKSSYGITIPYKAVDKNKDVGDKEIIVGFVRENVLYAASKMSIKNDFVLDVCDNDYVIYAPTDALYTYAFCIFEDEILSKTNDGKLTIKPEDECSYKRSEYKDINLASYLKEKNGSYNKDLLCRLFNGLSFTATDGTTLPYRLYLPSNYDKSVDYPVVLFLHGAGERGYDNYSHMNNMVPNMFNQENSTLIENAIVICPQCPQYPNQWVDTPWVDGSYSIESVPESNELKAVVELLESVKAKYSTDEDRYYAMGISMGGFGTWDLIMRHPDLFAAAVPVCGGADPSQANNLKYMPIYTAHASNDNIVPFSGTMEMVEALKNAGSKSVIFKQHADNTLESGGHLIWGEIGNRPDMLKWLFDQKKSLRPTDENELPVKPAQ